MPSRRTAMRAAGASLAAVALYLLAWPVPIDPVAWDPPDASQSEERWRPTGDLRPIERIETGGRGPEDVAIDEEGRIHTGLEDGRILRFSSAREVPETLANTQGRPLGLAFDAKGRLVIADARRGLLRLGTEGAIEVLCDRAAERAVRFADDLAIAPDGVVWFSEASAHFDVAESERDAIDGRPTGRLLRWDPRSGDCTVELDDLRYANGVALGPDGSFVLVSETFGYRITRLWLEGEAAGTTDRFAENLPGFPDNVNVDDEGIVWVALVRPRSKLLDAVYPHPFARKVIARLPKVMVPAPPSPGWILGLDGHGDPVHSLFDPSESHGVITSVTPHGRELLLGSLREGALGRIPRP